MALVLKNALSRQLPLDRLKQLVLKAGSVEPITAMRLAAQANRVDVVVWLSTLYNTPIPALAPFSDLAATTLIGLRRYGVLPVTYSDVTYDMGSLAVSDFTRYIALLRNPAFPDGDVIRALANVIPPGLTTRTVEDLYQAGAISAARFVIERCAGYITPECLRIAYYHWPDDKDWAAETSYLLAAGIKYDDPDVADVYSDLLDEGTPLPAVPAGRLLTFTAHGVYVLALETKYARYDWLGDFTTAVQLHYLWSVVWLLDTIARSDPVTAKTLVDRAFLCLCSAQAGPERFYALQGTLVQTVGPVQVTYGTVGIAQTSQTYQCLFNVGIVPHTGQTHCPVCFVGFTTGNPVFCTRAHPICRPCYETLAYWEQGAVHCPVCSSEVIPGQ